VYPLLAIYYGAMSTNYLHKLYQYNTVHHSIPKWSFLWRAYFHVVLLEDIPFAGILSIFALIILMVWKDMRFLVFHAEKRLKAIDEALYKHNYRITHLHYQVFDEDIRERKHVHKFNTNQLDAVEHTYMAEKYQNAIRNYVQYRDEEHTMPQNMIEWEEKTWRASSYEYIFLKNRLIYTMVPLFYVVFGVSICFSFAASEIKTRIYINALLFYSDIVSTLLCSNVTSDVAIDVSYALAAALLLT